MKRAIGLFGAATLMAGSVFAGPDAIIKQRALEIRDQNNVRQGVTPPSQPAHPAPPPDMIYPRTPIQQSVSKLRADLTAIKANTPAPAGQKQQLPNDLFAA